MDFETYRKKYLVDPPPVPRFSFGRDHDLALTFEAFDEAVAYYERVLGPAAFVMGTGTRSWQIGESWLTLLRGSSGNPERCELILRMSSPAEAERLQAAFIDAGGTGEPPSDQILNAPVRYCPVVDPFGMNIIVIAFLETGSLGG